MGQCGVVCLSPCSRPLRPAVNRPPLRGSAQTPILVFAGIVGLSVAFFFIFSAGSLNKRKSPGPGSGPVAPGPAPGLVPVTADIKPAVTVPSGDLPAGAPQVTAFASLEGLLAELAVRLRANDYAAVRRMTAESPPAEERIAFLQQVLTKCGWRVAVARPWVEAGILTGLRRCELKLEPSEPGAATPAGSVMADCERIQGVGWKVKNWRFDPALITQTATLSGARPAASIKDAADPLDTARRFFDSVQRHDFKAARGFTDTAGVTHEKLAGMCIVFEDGGYTLKPNAPVRITAATERTAWAFIPLASDRPGAGSGEVGLEMERGADGWRIKSLDFNSLLETYVHASGAGKVFYSPIVKSARGGESIVLYFEFDKAGLHPRALHQLNIIAGLLKTDTAKKIKITGHSDALGTDDYNVRLSATRAKNVSARLLELGVPAAQIETRGFGSAAPLDPDKLADGRDNPDGRSRNRRTEIYLDF
jgi:OOP family OmpA-OmpF porin